jgi:hypothetical protein
MLNLSRRGLFCQEQMPHQSLKGVNLLEEMEKLYVVVGKTGSRFFGGGPPAKWVIHGGPHRGTRPKRSKLKFFYRVQQQFAKSLSRLLSQSAAIKIPDREGTIPSPRALSEANTFFRQVLMFFQSVRALT